MTKIIFSHGKESGPLGKKIRLMMDVAAEFGFDSKSIDYKGIHDVDERVSMLRSELLSLNSEGIILVGSSMGGYVSTVISTEFPIKGLFLLCPALYKEDYPIQEYQPLTKNITLIHGCQDDIIPYENSIKFGKRHQANVVLVNDNHRLSNTRDMLVQQFRLFLSQF